jgi:hypothetical protein
MLGLDVSASSDLTANGGHWAWFGNLDRDPDAETLFLYHPVSHDPAGASLVCFGKGGREKWRFAAGRPVSDGLGAYTRDYSIASFLVADESGHPNQFVLLSNHGRVIGEYWHSGHLPELNVADITGDGRPEILLAGVNSGYSQATLIALDPARLSGASSQPAGDTHQLQGWRPAAEKARLLFPRSCVNRVLEESNRVTRLLVRDGLTEVTVSERSSNPPNRAIYTFGANLRIVNVRFSEEWRREHRKMELNRVLRHTLTDRELRTLATPQSITRLPAGS